MNGFHIADAGHVVNILTPQSISGGVTAQAFSLKNAEHVSIILQFGVFGSALPTAILLNACSSAAGAGATAIPFRYYYNNTGGTSNDVLTGGGVVAATGILAAAMVKNNAQFLVIEVDAAEIDFLGDSNGSDFPYLQLQITDSGNTTFASAVAVLSGVRQQFKGGVTATA